MPPLSPPDPDLNPEVLEQLLQKASPAITDNRFSMADFLKNKAAMTTAARRELAGGADHTLHRPAAEDDDITTSLEGAVHVLLAGRERGNACAACRKGGREAVHVLLAGREGISACVACRQGQTASHALKLHLFGFVIAFEG
jgi:hypothetical protein